MPLFLCCLIATVAFLGYVLFGSWNGLLQPLIGLSDIDSNQHLGYFFGRLLQWNPLPKIDFHTDVVGYPYGVQSAMQGWFLERELLSTFLGPNGWIHFYLILSFFIVGMGCFCLLRREFGGRPARIFSLSVLLFNFYSVHRYPGATSFVSCHWVILSVVTDFLLCHRVSNKKSLSLSWILFRFTLLVLSLGHELGTVAGISLTSFTLSGGWIVGRHWKTLRSAPFHFAEDFKRSPFLCGCLLLISGTGLTLYLPILFELRSVFSQYPAVEAGSFWANPIRLFLPWLPFFHPGLEIINPTLDDNPESLGALSVGYPLLIVGLCGFYQVVRKRKWEYGPLLLFLVMVLLYHPKLIPTMQVFPWFSHMRVTSRFTLIFPTLFALLGLAAWPWLKQQKHLAMGLVVLAMVEIFTAYIINPVQRPFSPTPSYFSYMKTIRETPGEAILDWPFCVHGGNGIPKGLCPFGVRHESVFTLQRFHHKKTVGYYIGRLTPEMVAPFFEHGWQFILPSTREKRCLSPKQQAFLMQFYRAHDFAGINLHIDFIHPNCLTPFYNTFGTPVAFSKVQGAGNVAFIPKQPKISIQNEGNSPRYQPPLESTQVDFLSRWNPSQIELKGLGEKQGTQLPVRKGFARIRFFTPTATKYRLKTQMGSFLYNQKVQLKINGNEYNRNSLKQPQSWLSSFTTQPGWNVIEFLLEKDGHWSHVFERYQRDHGWIGFLNFFKLQRYYKAHRHQPAYFEQLVLTKVDITRR